jgi:hypothetical protein
VRDQWLPVESGDWTHCGGNEVYPVECFHLTAPDSAWAVIAALHAQNRAYNLLYTPGAMYCLPRKMQGGFELAGWSNGFSWYELCGGMITFNHQDYRDLTAGRIQEALSRLRIDTFNLD